MKNVVLLFFLALISMPGIAQTHEKKQSNAEKFSSKSGTLIKKEFITIGEVKECEISVVHFTDLISKSVQSAVRFKYESAGKYSSEIKSAILDADEIDGLIASIKLMQDSIFRSSPVNYTEVNFKSRGGFEAGCFWSKDDNKWSVYLKLEQYDSDSYVWLKQEDFEELMALLREAKGKLK